MQQKFHKIVASMVTTVLEVTAWVNERTMIWAMVWIRVWAEEWVRAWVRI